MGYGQIPPYLVDHEMHLNQWKKSIKFLNLYKGDKFRVW